MINFNQYSIIFFMSLGIAFTAHSGAEIIGEGAIKRAPLELPYTCKVNVIMNAPRGIVIHQCTGTLIDSRHVVTAAHCFSGDFKLTQNTFINLTCGDENLSEVVAVQLPPSTPEEITSSGKWTPPTIKDVALITVKSDACTEPLPYAKDLNQYFDSSGNLNPTSHCFIAGYGNNAIASYGTLMSASLDQYKVRKSNYGINLSSNSQDYLKTSVDHGDSGGSLICKNNESKPELVGIISSHSCIVGDENKRVSNNFSPVSSEHFLKLIAESTH